MKSPRSRILALLAIPLLVVASFQLVSQLGSTRANGQRSETSERDHEGKESPPEDWFITQRVTHGGIPADALEKAAAQAAALTLATGQSDSQLAAARWKFVGPTNIGGRVVDIAVDPVIADTIYVAAATGGVWKSKDRGARFTSIWPAANPQSMGALLITSNGTLFAGTGEANPGGGSLTYGGGGIYRSVDVGRTWQLVGLTNSGAIGRLAVDPNNPQHIFAAAAGQLYNHGGERGVYESTDGGSTWTQVLAGDNDTTGAVDLAIDPSNPNRVFAAMWDHLREPDLRTYGGVGSGVYRSTDGGSTWQRLTNGLPASSATIGRIGIALAASNPQRLYAIVNQTNGLFQGFYESDNGGDSWTKLPTQLDALRSAVDLRLVVRTGMGRSSRPDSRFRRRGLSVRVEEQRLVVHGRVQPTRRRSRHGVGPQSARPRLPRQRRRDLSIGRQRLERPVDVCSQPAIYSVLQRGRERTG